MKLRVEKVDSFGLGLRLDKNKKNLRFIFIGEAEEVAGLILDQSLLNFPFTIPV